VAEVHIVLVILALANEPVTAEAKRQAADFQDGTEVGSVLWGVRSTRVNGVTPQTPKLFS